MARRRDEMQTEAFQVIVGIVQGADLEFAAIAGTRIHLPDVKRPAEELLRLFVQSGSHTFDAGVFARGTSLRDDPGFEEPVNEKFHR